MNLKQILVAGMVSLAGLLPMKAEGQIKGFFSSSINSHYVAKGFVLGKGPHKQDTIMLGKNGINTYFWSDYDFGRKLLQEIDFGGSYSKKLNESFSLEMGYLYMWYPEGPADKVPNFAINYQGGFNVNADFYWFLENKAIPNGLVVDTSVSKLFPLGKRWFLSGKFKSIFVNNFYKDSGVSGLSPGVEVTYNPRNFSLTGYLSKQLGFIPHPKMLPAAKNQVHGGIEFKANF